MVVLKMRLHVNSIDKKYHSAVSESIQVKYSISVCECTWQQHDVYIDSVRFTSLYSLFTVV